MNYAPFVYKASILLYRQKLPTFLKNQPYKLFFRIILPKISMDELCCKSIFPVCIDQLHQALLPIVYFPGISVSKCAYHILDRFAGFIITVFDSPQEKRKIFHVIRCTGINRRDFFSEMDDVM